MKYLFWTACFLLLDLSISQEVEIPCTKLTDCQTLSTAQPGMQCVNGICKCPDNAGILKNCAPINASSASTEQRSGPEGGLVGRVCTIEGNCGNAEMNAICNTTRKQCQCKPGFVGSLDHRKCLPAIEWGKSGCEITKQCQATTTNSTCENGACACQADSHYNSGACWVNRGFGSTCSVTQECSLVENAICDNQFRCSCPVNRVINPNSTGCLSIAAKIEDDCVEAIQCSQLLGEGGTCMEQHCRCHEHYHYSSNLNKCVKNLDMGAECQNDDECSNGVQEGGNNGPLRCLANRCECAEDFANVEGKCEPVLRQDPNSANRLVDVSTFALALGYFVLLSLGL